MGREVSFAGSSNDIVQYVRFRQGTLDSDTGKSSLSLSDASDVIFDHISVEFGQWDDIDAVGASDITIQDSIIADPIGQQFAMPLPWAPAVICGAARPRPAWATTATAPITG